MSLRCSRMETHAQGHHTVSVGPQPLFPNSGVLWTVLPALEYHLPLFFGNLCGYWMISWLALQKQVGGCVVGRGKVH